MRDTVPLTVALRTAAEKPEGFDMRKLLGEAADEIERAALPVPMLICCPACGERHIDEGEFATKAHHTHACQGCGMTWRPAVAPTVGVRFLPGFKNPS